MLEIIQKLTSILFYFFKNIDYIKVWWFKSFEVMMVVVAGWWFKNVQFIVNKCM